MKIGKTIVHLQYFWLDSKNYGRAVTSSGKHWFGWYERTQRLNVWRHFDENISLFVFSSVFVV
jgi:hypothetical protein